MMMLPTGEILFLKNIKVVLTIKESALRQKTDNLTSVSFQEQGQKRTEITTIDKKHLETLERGDKEQEMSPLIHQLLKKIIISKRKSQKYK